MLKNKNLIINGVGGQPKQGLKLKWNLHDVYTVENLINVEINTYEDIMFLYHHGIKNKAIGGHKMNMTSSRSHTILTYTLE